MSTGTISSQPELGHEENIAAKDSHASDENSSVDGKHISDFMGKRRADFHLTDDLPFKEMSHGTEALPPGNASIGSTRVPTRQRANLYKAKACATDCRGQGRCPH
jgi:hypothetical protein